MKKTKQTVIAFTLLLISLCYFLFWQVELEKRLVYPFAYSEYIFRYAEEEGINPKLVASVVLAESKFNIRAESHRGAVGLMQIMPETGAWIAATKPYDGYKPEMLKEIPVNLALGTWYLNYLLKEFHGNTILALAAYNAGRGHVEDWIQQYQWTTDFNNIDEIPFAETREYIKLVLQNEKEYDKLYK